MNIEESIKPLIEQIAQLYRNNLEEDKYVSSGQLKNFTTEFTYDNFVFKLYFNLPKYWKYVENGTQPHFPPVAAIEEWIKIKGIVPRAGKNGKVPSTKSLAYMISRNMAKVGTQSMDGNKISAKTPLKRMIESNTLDELLDKIREIIVNDVNDKIMEEYKEMLDSATTSTRKTDSDIEFTIKQN